MRQASRRPKDNLRGFICILTVDLVQLPPVNDDALWYMPSKRNKQYHNKMIARHLCRSFEDVIVLTKQFRQKEKRDIDIL